MEDNKYFHRIPLTEDVITKLGFGEYWGDCGDSGTRNLTNPDKPNFGLMRIHEVDQKDDACDGYCMIKEYVANHFTTEKFESIYFLHELFDEAEKNFPDAIPLLTGNAKKYNMWFAMESYYGTK